MGLNLSNFLISKSKKQENDGISRFRSCRWLSISSVCANLYKNTRDDLVLFYFREAQIMHLFILNQRLYLRI